MMCNEGCKGYVMKALNEMLKENRIEYAVAKEVLEKVNEQFGELSDEDARQYYIDNWLLNNEEN